MSQVVIDVPDCPRQVPMALGVPSWVVGWGLVVSAVIVLAFIVATAIVRWNAAENKTEQLRNRNDALIGAAEVRKHCLTCGADYPSEKDVA